MSALTLSTIIPLAVMTFAMPDHPPLLSFTKYILNNAHNLTLSENVKIISKGNKLREKIISPKVSGGSLRNLHEVNNETKQQHGHNMTTHTQGDASASNNIYTPGHAMVIFDLAGITLEILC